MGSGYSSLLTTCPKAASGEYELKVHHRSDEDLDKVMDELLGASEADGHNCFSESEWCLEGTDRHWGCVTRLN
jgi:hypothetical protein